MKRTIAIGLILALIAVSLTARAQAPGWQSAISVGGTGIHYAATSAMTTDGTGNVYIVGTFVGTIHLGSLALTSTGTEDGFVAKWSSATNTFLWAQRAGGSGSTEPMAVVVTAGRVYVAGRFNGSAATFGSTVLTRAGGYDAFVAKLTDSGATAAFTWARRAGGTNDDVATGVAVSISSVYVAGTFYDRADFGSYTQNSFGLEDGFVTKLNDAGSTSTFNWAAHHGGPFADYASSIAVNGNNLYVGGGFQWPSQFGAIPLNTSGGFAGYVTKITDSFNGPAYVWAQKVDNTDDINEVTSVAVNGNRIYVAGSIRGTATLGPFTLTSVGSYDAYVAKLTDAGSSASFVWAQRMGGTDSDAVFALAVDGAKVYLGGGFKAVSSFGSTGLTGAGEFDAFVARLTDGGASSTIDWAQAAGGISDEYVTAITVISPGKVYVGGFYQPPINFGAITLTAPFGSNSGAFLASLTDNLGTATRAASAGPTLAFYPNPARTLVQVPAATAATVLTLSDGLGRTVRTTAGAQLSVAGLAPGLYLLHAATPGQPGRAARLVVE